MPALVPMLYHGLIPAACCYWQPLLGKHMSVHVVFEGTTSVPFANGHVRSHGHCCHMFYSMPVPGEAFWGPPFSANGLHDSVGFAVIIMAWGGATSGCMEGASPRDGCLGSFDPMLADAGHLVWAKQFFGPEYIRAYVVCLPLDVAAVLCCQSSSVALHGGLKQLRIAVAVQVLDQALNASVCGAWTFSMLLDQHAFEMAQELEGSGSRVPLT